MISEFANEIYYEDENNADIVIVGAGLTGLAAAYNIARRKSGLNILIIERTDVAGGRILSEEYSNAFYASSFQHRITGLLKVFGIPTYSKVNINEKKRVFLTKSGPTEQLSAYHAIEVHYFLRLIHEISSNSIFKTYTINNDAYKLAETSVEQLLKKLVFFSYCRSICSSLIYSTCGVKNLKDVSALWWLITLKSAGGMLKRLQVTTANKHRYFIQGGMTRIIKELLKRLDSEDVAMRYSEPVVQIQFNDDRVYVHTTQHCFRCDRVIITVPPPGNSQITIEPTIPKHISQTLYVQAENTFFNASYRQPFWSDEYSGEILTTTDSNTILNIAYDATYSDNKATIAGFFNESPTTLPNLDLFKTLHECFRTPNAEDWIIFRKKEFINLIEIGGGGSPMSYMKPGHLSNHVNLMTQPNDRIFFAASEYAFNWPGTIEGAIEAGEIASCQVLSRIRPQMLNFADMVSISKRSSFPSRFSIEIALLQYFLILVNIYTFISFLKAA